MKQPTFEESLARGREAEKAVSGWLQRRGWGVIPSYNYTSETGPKGPRARFLSESLIIPDLDVFKGGARRWVEVKYYDHAPLNRKLGKHVHGIPRYYYDHYMRVEMESGHRVYLAIVEDRIPRLLIAELKTLPIYPCQCGGCRQGSPAYCTAPLRNGVYFSVDDFCEFPGRIGEWREPNGPRVLVG